MAIPPSGSFGAHLLQLLPRPSILGVFLEREPIVANCLLGIATLGICPGKRVELIRKPLPADDPKRRCPDITLAKSLLGFTPKVPLEEGIAATYADFKERLSS